MAQVTSGSFNTTKYNNKKYLVFSWSIKSQDVANNKTTIQWSLKGAGADGYHMAGNFKVVIAGETVYSSSTRIQLTNSTTVASGTKVITHNSNGTKTFSASAEAGIYQVAVNCSGSGTWELKAIPRAATITSAPNFTDEENPTISYSNLAGNNATSLQACIADTDGKIIYVPYRDISKTGTSYTFTLTDAERATLRKAVTSGYTKAVRFYVKTVISGTNYYNNSQKTLTLVNYKPTIAPTVIDVNELTTNLTGSPDVLIKYFSNVDYAVNASAKKEATISAVSVKNGSSTKSTATGSFDGVTDNKFTFYAKDSRGHTVETTKTLTMVDYTKLTCDLEAKMELKPDVEDLADVYCTVSGNFFNDRFSAGGIDNFLNIYYRYKIGQDDWGEWVNVTDEQEFTVTDNKYSLSFALYEFDYRDAVTVQCMASDELMTEVLSAEITVNAMPVFDWGVSDFSFNVPVYVEGNWLGDFIVEYGSGSMGSNGTWYIEKWASGKAVCYGRRNFGNMAVSTAWGNLYKSAEYTQALPNNLFIDTPPILQIDVRAAGAACFAIRTATAATSATNSGSFAVASGASGNISSVNLSFYCVGKWR